MSSMPREIIVDTLLPLDRSTLDTVQITNKRIDFAPALATLALEKTPIVVHKFHAFLSHFSPTKLHLGFESVDMGSLSVMDDTVVAFCMQPDVPAAQGVGERKPYAKLRVSNGRFSRDLFKRLVEASAVSTRTRRFRVRLEPVRFEGEDLRDYAHHLSHHLGRGQPWEHRIYDFFGEQRGEVDAVDLQISLERSALSTRYTLEMDRGLREGLWGLRTNRLPPELY